MTNIAAEIEKYNHAWNQERYRKACHGLDFYNNYRDLLPDKITSAMDFGCGTGRLLKQMVDDCIDAYGMDLVPNSVDADIMFDLLERIHFCSLQEFNADGRFHVGICADVMEHIPESEVYAVVENMSIHCDTMYFVIANYPSQMDGRNFHLSLHDSKWWMEVIGQFGDVELLKYQRDARDAFAIRLIPEIS